jgi:hypothetical protein
VTVANVRAPSTRLSVRTAASNPTGPIGRIPKRIGRYLDRDDRLVRFVSPWGVVASVFAAAWVLSHLLFPEGLRGGNPGTSTGYAGSITREFLRLFGWNVGVSLIAIGANTFRSVNTPMGTVIDRPGALVRGGGPGRSPSGRARIAPSLSVLVERSGSAEIAAIVATRGVMILCQESGPRWRGEFDRVRPGTGR